MSPAISTRRGKWAELFLSMAGASRVGQASLPHLRAPCKFHDFRSSEVRASPAHSTLLCAFSRRI
jgi:hypothetical protein